MNLSDYTTAELEAELSRRPDASPILYPAAAREKLLSMRYESCCQAAARIIREVAISFNAHPDEIRGRCRHPRTSRARRVAMAALLAEGHTLRNIARFFGRDHTTVRYSIAKLRKP